MFNAAHPLISFQMQKHYQNKAKFIVVYSRNNLSKIKDGAHIIHLDEYESIGTNWIALDENDENATYFDSFWVEHFRKEIRKFIENKDFIANIYRIQAYDSIMYGYVCIGLLDLMLKGKSLLE